MEKKRGVVVVMGGGGGGGFDLRTVKETCMLMRAKHIQNSCFVRELTLYTRARVNL